MNPHSTSATIARLAEDIIRIVSETIGVELTFLKSTDKGIICRDTDGFKYLIHGHLWAGKYVVRAVARQTRKGSRICFWPGGEVTVGKQIRRWEENGENSLHIAAIDN